MSLGQDDTFFHLNHPIRWVRIIGVVVAIDTYYGRRIYTVDDSTGLCIECSVNIPTPKDSSDQKAAAQKESVDASAPALYPDIDVGMVVDVKGSLNLFREQKQIKIGKMQHVRSTNQEVQFWNKIKVFRVDVLNQPWVLERKVLRRLEKENKADLRTKDKEKDKIKSKRPQQQNQDRLGESSSKDAGKHRSHSGRRSSDTGFKKPYKPSKLSSVTMAEEGQYDALGL
jgi:hypothetical protein